MKHTVTAVCLVVILMLIAAAASAGITYAIIDNRHAHTAALARANSGLAVSIADSLEQELQATQQRLREREEEIAILRASNHKASRIIESLHDELRVAREGQ